MYGISNLCILAIYGPMIYKALYVILLMRANPLRELVGRGWALEIKTFLSSVRQLQAVRQVPCGVQKSRDFLGPPPPTCPSHGFARVKSIALRTGPRGPYVVLCT
jgi:hypothetical protein